MLSIIVCIFSFFCSETNDHDFHISNTEINYDESEKELQIMVHVFIDDLEESILESYDDSKFWIGTEKELSNADSMIQVYLNDNFSLALAQEKLPLNYLGKEIDDDLAGITLYLSAELQNVNQSINIFNSILVDTFSDQKNIIQTKFNNEAAEFYVLTKSNQQKTININ